MCASDSECSSVALPPACNASGACVTCHVGMSGTAARCLQGQVCIIGTSGPECVQCDDDAHCGTDGAPLCNRTTHMCVPCSPASTADDTRCNAKLTASGGGVCATGGVCRRCDTVNHEGCMPSDLCCLNGTNLVCQSTGASQCTACGVPCAPGTGVCGSARSCGCATDANCGGTTPACIGGACKAYTACTMADAACATDTAHLQCVALLMQCRECDPMDAPSTCPPALPTCSATTYTCGP
jgi:hypothetical protein